MDAPTVFAEIMSRVASVDECPCLTLTELRAHDNVTELCEHVIDGAVFVLQSTDDPAQARDAIGHLLRMLVATGYAMGARDTSDLVTVDVPDSLASVAWLTTPALGERPDDN